jgi:hypothetical protein
LEMLPLSFKNLISAICSNLINIYPQEKIRKNVYFGTRFIPFFNFYTGFLTLDLLPFGRPTITKNCMLSQKILAFFIHKYHEWHENFVENPICANLCYLWIKKIKKRLWNLEIL